MKIDMQCQSLDVAIGGRTLIRALDLELAGGRTVCLLGENGTGKTSALHTMAGLLAPAGGEILIAGRQLDTWARRDLATHLGLLMQDSEDAFPATVLETALIGRHPYLGLFGWESREDLAQTRQALDRVGLEGLEQRPVQTLSGGERRRLAIATVLVQDPDIFLLDEPINHLDPRHQIGILYELQRLAAKGKSIIASLHDVNLARRFFDDALLLDGEGGWRFGPALEVLTPERLRDAFHTDFAAVGDGERQYLMADAIRESGSAL